MKERIMTNKTPSITFEHKFLLLSLSGNTNRRDFRNKIVRKNKKKICTNVTRLTRPLNVPDNVVENVQLLTSIYNSDNSD